jgi:hypothetical protein
VRLSVSDAGEDHGRSSFDGGERTMRGGIAIEERRRRGRRTGGGDGGRGKSERAVRATLCAFVFVMSSAGTSNPLSATRTVLLQQHRRDEAGRQKSNKTQHTSEYILENVGACGGVCRLCPHFWMCFLPNRIPIRQ